MAGYLFRRILQMILVIILSAIASYIMLNLAPGGPLSGLSQQQQLLRTWPLAEQTPTHSSVT